MNLVLHWIHTYSCLGVQQAWPFLGTGISREQWALGSGRLRSAGKTDVQSYSHRGLRESTPWDTHCYIWRSHESLDRCITKLQTTSFITQHDHLLNTINKCPARWDLCSWRSHSTALCFHGPICQMGSLCTYLLERELANICQASGGMKLALWMKEPTTFLQ